MNPKVIMLIMFLVLLNSAQAMGFGSAAGNIDGFRSGSWKDSLGKDRYGVIIHIDLLHHYTRSRISMPGSFEYHDFSGAGTCTVIANMRAVLDLSDISSNPSKKIMYSMLVSAYLLKRPVSLVLAGCMQIFSGADAAKIELVDFVNQK